MSFQNKSFWMAKGADGDPAFEGPSKIEPKRSHQWLVDDAEPALFSNKKQALFAPNSTTGSVMQDAPSWDSTPSFQSVPTPFIHRLLGSETATSISFSERELSAAGTDNSNVPVSLSISQAVEDPEACPSYGSLRRVKVNQVKDTDNGIYALKENSFTAESNSEISTSQAFNGRNESSFISIGQAYDKRDGNITLMGHSYGRGDTDIGSGSPSYIQADENGISISDSYSKEEVNMISFGGFPDDAHDIVPVGRSISSYDQSYNQPSDQPLEEVHGKELDASNANAAVGKSRTAKLKPASVSKNKPEFKATKKEAPNSFPSNVRSLISTGMLDGVPVKYVSVSREELHGVIKGSGYLCGCQLCNYSKVINAYEFERHAGCKTKHPNNHIFFENGKTIYQIVQELRSTPESLLFEVIQTVFGAPINQKAFRSWKESFQAATRELQRIYGKEQLNL